MSIPSFIAQSREKIGHDLMLLPGVCALVLNDALPELHPAHCARIKDACAGGATWFAPPGESVTHI